MNAEPPGDVLLSEAQLARLAAIGEERTAPAGATLADVGDAEYAFMAIVDGEAVVHDAAGEEIDRLGPHGFIGEMDLLSGQTVFFTATVTQTLRYVAVARPALRTLLFEDGPLSDLLLATFMRRREMLQRTPGAGLEILGPRESDGTRRIIEFARRLRIPFTWRDPAHDAAAAELLAELHADEIPLVRIPGGRELRGPGNGQLSRSLGIGLELGPLEEVDLLIVGAGPAGLAAAVYGASEGLETLVVERSGLGGQAALSRRIENLLGFPAGITGAELSSRAVAQARKFGARTATPYEAIALKPGTGRHVVHLDDDRTIMAQAVLIATGADYRRLAVPELDQYEGLSVLYEAGPPEAVRTAGTRVGVIGGGNSAGQAAIWLARGGALVTLMHRRRSVHETMSSYLVDELEAAGVEVRPRSEIAELHGTAGELAGVTLNDGTHLSLSSLFLFLGAEPCTDWLSQTIARDPDGFILTGAPAGSTSLLETSIDGVFAAGDVRAGSSKRCATAIGEGAAVVQAVHDQLAAATRR